MRWFCVGGAFVDAGFVVAAASLTPERAERWLLAAFDRFRPDGGLQWGTLLVGLHRYGSAESIPIIADRFYIYIHSHRTVLDRWMMNGSVGSQLCEALAADRTTRARATLLAMVEHYGLRSADAETIFSLAGVVRAFTRPQALLTIDRQRLQYPFESAGHQTEAARVTASRAYPKETEDYYATLDSWRAALLDSRKDWAP